MESNFQINKVFQNQYHQIKNFQDSIIFKIKNKNTSKPLNG